MCAVHPCSFKCTVGTFTGSGLTVDIVRTPGTLTTPPVLESKRVWLALHGIHMDYIMRAHVTKWYGPTADHPGGWCKCYKGQAIDSSSGNSRAQGQLVPVRMPLIPCLYRHWHLCCYPFCACTRKGHENSL